MRPPLALSDKPRDAAADALAGVGAAGTVEYTVESSSLTQLLRRNGLDKQPLDFLKLECEPAGSNRRRRAQQAAAWRWRRDERAHVTPVSCHRLATRWPPAHASRADCAAARHSPPCVATPTSCEGCEYEVFDELRSMPQPAMRIRRIGGELHFCNSRRRLECGVFNDFVHNTWSKAAMRGFKAPQVCSGEHAPPRCKAKGKAMKLAKDGKQPGK